MKDMLKKVAPADALKKAASRAARIRISKRVGISILCILICLPLIYAALGFWVLPSWIKSKAQSIASEKLHRQLVINKLEFNPFTFTLNVEGLSLSEAKSDERFVSFDQLYVELSTSSVLQMTPVVTEFKLVKPFVRVIRLSDRERNFDDILALFKKPEGEEEKEEEKKAEPEKRPQNAEERRAERRKRKFGIYNFQIIDARIELENREKGTKTVVSDFNVGLPYLYRGPIRGIQRHVEPHFEALINGKKLEILREKPSEDSRDRILNLNMDNIDLKRIFNYVPFHPAYKFNEGWLDLRLSLYIHRPRDGQTTMDVGGRVTVRSVHMTQHGKPLFDLEKLDLQLGTNSPVKGEYRVDKLEIIKPEFHAISDKNGVLNFANLLAHADKVVAPVEDEEEQKGKAGVQRASMKPGQEGAVIPASAETGGEPEPKGFTFALKELVVKKGRFRYADQSDAMPLDAAANGFDLTVNDVLLDSAKREISIARIASSSTAVDVAFAKERGRAPEKPDEDKSKKKAKEGEGYTLRLAKLEIANWSARLKNSNTADFAALPVSATLNKFGLTVSDAEVDLNTHAVKVGQIQSGGGSFDVALHSGATPASGRKAEKKDDASPAFTVQVGKLGITNWNGKVKNTSARDSASLPFSAAISRLGITVENTEVDLKNETVSVGLVQSSGGSFDVTLDDHPAGNRAPAAESGGAAFNISVGQVAIANWSGRLKNNNQGDMASLPASASISKFGLTVDKTQVDMKAHKVSVGQVRSTGGSFDMLMENHAPKAPVAGASAKTDSAPYHIRIGKVDVANWSGKVKNSNRHDPFEMPFSATLTKLGVTVDNAEVNLKDQTVTVASVSTKGGHADVDIEPWKKPTNVGKRAAARAALLTSIIEAKKAQAADGLAISVGKVAVSGWSARMKNRNPTNRAGMPISGRANQIDLAVNNIRLDTKKRDIRIGEIASKGVVLMGQLEKHEKWDPKKAAGGGKPVDMPSDAPYNVQIDKLAVSGWSVKGRNINLKNPLGGSITGLSVTGQNLSSTPGQSSQFSVRATVDKTGKFAADGKVGISPLSVDLALDMKDLSIVAIQPYIEDYVNLTLNRANLSLTGNLVLKENRDGTLEGGYRGDVTVAQLRTVDQINKDSFIRWNNFALKDVDAKFMPLLVNVKEAELNNFFARVILNPDGRLNLRNILRSDAGGLTSLTESESELDDLADAGDGKESQVQTKGNVTTGTVRPDADGADASQPVILVERLTLKKGRVRFTDNFIKPNYTANISELEGTVTGFSSDPSKFAKLDLRGQVNKAPLIVAGTISPLREKLALDVKAQVRGMELAQFSSYTTKYIGYGIDKGKLSFDVEYKLDEGVLVAQNRLILDQLTFGEKAEGEPVTSLPVELAVSLLKDGNGVIDINLPIGGSLDDPEFSIGGILAKVFLSSLKRVILAPFAFLSIKFGGGAEMAWLEFEPGSFVIPEKELPKLEAMAKAFAERPELKLDITGRYDPSADRAGLAKAGIQRKVRALKRKDLQEKGQTVMMNQLKVEDSEYPELLERVYKDEDIKKPRNFIGMQKKLSVPEMEKVMVDGYEATEEEFLALAYQRSERVKVWLVEQGKIADSRIFLLASKAGEAGENGESAARVDFAIQQ
ncbi:DUF748 domain-containing protein [Oxalobacter sp. OttesenSCG-928-P03]|nr:DUF748 domain-containing protein [Oxalobacter sp. OttesenSCG-928-P03]